MTNELTNESDSSGEKPEGRPPPEEMGKEELRHRVMELEGRIEEVENRLDSLEGLFTERVIDRERAHTRAKREKANEKLSRGEEKDVVIESFTDNGQALTHIKGIVTFVKNWRPADEGDTIRIKIIDVGENAANAIRVDND